MSITGSNNPFACEPVVFANANSIVSLGTITRDGNQFTFSVGFVWKINGVTYQNTAPVVLTIAEASTGFQRIDNALLNTSNTIELQQGLESATIALQPVAPDTNIILTSWNISGTAIEDTETPILGTQFKKKSESSAFVDGSLTGEKAVIQLRPQGNSFYAVSGASLVSIDGFGLDLITGNPSAEPPYIGKDLFIQNIGSQPFDLLHDGDGMATAKFRFFNEQNLTVPPQGVVLLKYFTPYCEVIFKSWADVSGEKYKDYFQFLTTRQTLTATGTWRTWSNSYNGNAFWNTSENTTAGTAEFPNTSSNRFGIVTYKEDIQKLKYLIWEEAYNDIYSKQILIKKTDFLLAGTGSNTPLNERTILNEIISFNALTSYRPIRFKFLVDDSDDTPEGYCSKYTIYIKDISGAGFSTRTIRWRFLERQ